MESFNKPRVYEIRILLLSNFVFFSNNFFPNPSLSLLETRIHYPLFILKIHLSWLFVCFVKYYYNIEVIVGCVQIVLYHELSMQPPQSRSLLIWGAFTLWKLFLFTLYLHTFLKKSGLKDLGTKFSELPVTLRGATFVFWCNHNVKKSCRLCRESWASNGSESCKWRWWRLTDRDSTKRQSKLQCR